MPDLIKKDEKMPTCANHLVRQRINTLLTQASKKPLTIVCAGMGCGKTRAVYDFTQESKIPAAWIQLSESDNVESRFWEIFSHAVGKISRQLTKEYRKLGFPDTNDKMNVYFSTRDRLIGTKPRILVFDDVHFINNSAILYFLEQAVNKLPDIYSSIILITREMPKINISSLMFRDNVTIINESDLDFTENELNQFLMGHGLAVDAAILSKIIQDTGGWAFIVNFIAQILKKTPGYSGYAQISVKQDIFQLLEMEAWNSLPQRLRNLLLRLTLIDHRSIELVKIIAEGDEELINELKRHNAFIRFDGYTESCYIHHLYIKFLLTKQDLLSNEDKIKTWKFTADWCIKNGFLIDAFFNYSKINDYGTIVSSLFSSSEDSIRNIAQHIIVLFDNAPKEIYDNTDLSAAMHIHLTFCLEKYKEAYDLIQHYEAKYLQLPEDDPFRNRMLGCIYYYWGIIRMMRCTTDGSYDFETYFQKMHKFLRNNPVNPKCWYQHPPCMWTNISGSPKQGSLAEFSKTLERSTNYIRKIVTGLSAGINNLCNGEMFFFRGDVPAAEPLIAKALEHAQKYGQYEIIFRAMFYQLWIAVYQGDYAKTGQTLKNIEERLAENEHSIRFLFYDIYSGWYYYTVNQPDKISGWLKDDFSFHYKYANTLESFGNQIKAKYFYLTKNYGKLLAYFEEKKQRVMVLYERIDLLAMEACVHMKMKNNRAAMAVLQKAWETASPNEIKLPFAELGKDMRQLINIALKDKDCNIPQSWLESIKQTASAYYRNQNLIIDGYNNANIDHVQITLSPREKEILRDMYEGLSRPEMAEKYGLSVNTVKQHINWIYNKTGARRRADIFRIAAENSLLE